MSGGSAQEGTTTGKDLIPEHQRAENRLKTLVTGLADMEKLSGALLINTEADQHVANEMISKAKVLFKAIEDKRVEIYDGLYPKQFRAIMKSANALAKGYQKRLSVITGGLEKKYLDYDRKVREAAALAEAEAIKAREAARNEIKEQAKFLPPDVAPSMELIDTPAPAPAPVENFTRSDSGVSYKKQVKGYEITDFSLVPDDYKLPNQVSIRAEMNRKDRKDIPGIKWTETEKLATRLK